MRAGAESQAPPFLNSHPWHRSEKPETPTRQQSWLRARPSTVVTASHYLRLLIPLESKVITPDIRRTFCVYDEKNRRFNFILQDRRCPEWLSPVSLSCQSYLQFRSITIKLKPFTQPSKGWNWPHSSQKVQSILEASQLPSPLNPNFILARNVLVIEGSRLSTYRLFSSLVCHSFCTGIDLSIIIFSLRCWPVLSCIVLDSQASPTGVNGSSCCPA